MIAPLLSLLLAAKLVAHSGTVLLSSPRTYTTLPVEIEVTDCRGNPALLYQDPKGVYLLVGNRYETDNFGEYKFFTTSPYAVLIITYNPGEPPLYIRTCPEPERTHR